MTCKVHTEHLGSGHDVWHVEWATSTLCEHIGAHAVVATCRDGRCGHATRGVPRRLTGGRADKRAADAAALKQVTRLQTCGTLPNRPQIRKV